MPKRKSGKPTRPVNIRARERELKAIELRKAGATYRQIGAQLGISGASAHDRVAAALADLNMKTKETAEETIRLELERLDAMLLGLWDRARRGDVDAIDRVIKIQKRRAELLGLDSPVQYQHTGKDGAPLFSNPETVRKKFDALVAAKVSGGVGK